MLSLQYCNYEKYDITKQGITLPCFYYNVVDSTNNAAKALVRDGAVEDTAVVIADAQTDGRGRYSRKFASPAQKGAYVTFVGAIKGQLKCELPFGGYAALAATRLVESLSGLKPTVKWPNDVKLNGNKICGILTETVQTAKGRFMAVGCGVNVNTNAKELGEYRTTATSLAIETGNLFSVKETAELLAVRMADVWQAFHEGKDLYCEYASCLETIGKSVKFGADGADFGTAVGIERDLSLIIERGGQRIKLNWGEICQIN